MKKIIDRIKTILTISMVKNLFCDHLLEFAYYEVEDTICREGYWGFNVSEANINNCKEAYYENYKTIDLMNALKNQTMIILEREFKNVRFDNICIEAYIWKTIKKRIEYIQKFKPRTVRIMCKKACQEAYLEYMETYDYDDPVNNHIRG